MRRNETTGALPLLGEREKAGQGRPEQGRMKAGEAGESMQKGPRGQGREEEGRAGQSRAGHSSPHLTP